MLNSVIIIGRLVKDVEVKEVKDKKIYNFTIAVSDGKNKDDLHVSYFDCVNFPKTTGLKDYLKKGQMIAIHGSLRQESWKDKNQKTQYAVRIYVNNIQLCGTRESKNVESTNSDGLPF